MKKTAIISSLHLYIINTVKKIRTDLGISFKDIAIIFDVDPINNPLGAIEGKSTTARYNDSHLNKLAKAFTEKSFELGQNISYTVADFYPPTDYVEDMVEKIISEIKPSELGQTGILHLLVVEETDPFFDFWRTAREIAEHCGTKAQKSWVSNDFTFIIDRAVTKGILVRKSDEQALFKRP